MVNPCALLGWKKIFGFTEIDFRNWTIAVAENIPSQSTHRRGLQFCLLRLPPPLPFHTPISYLDNPMVTGIVHLWDRCNPQLHFLERPMQSDNRKWNFVDWFYKLGFWLSINKTPLRNGLYHLGTYILYHTNRILSIGFWKIILEF